MNSNRDNYLNLCRTCLSDGLNKMPIFGTEQDTEQTSLYHKLIQCTSLPVGKNDGFPPSICFNCAEALDKAFSFRKLCEKSFNSLRSWINNFDYNNKSTETFESIKSDFKNEQDPHEKVSEADDLDESEKACSVSGDEYNESKMKETSRDVSKRKWKEYKCVECGEKCLGLGCYWKHMVKVHGKMFKCDTCAAELDFCRFKSMKLLAQHESVHNESQQKQSRKSKNKTGIMKPRNQPRTCEICNKTFRFHSNLERHKLIHTGEKPYLCNVCGKGFGQMSYLKIHSFIHTGEKPYKCRICDKSFAAPGTLMTHIRIHTGERPHVCKICGKDFPQSGYLSAHIRTHTGEKPIECKVCHRRFNQSGRLIIHMRIHSGEKPYSCSECGRSFAVRGTLKKHIRTHTGERPYICSVCGQAFAQSGTLATHMKVHRPKDGN